MSNNKKKQKRTASTLPPKLLRRPFIAAAVAITADIVMLAAAVVLNIIRSNFKAEYTLTSENTITASHPYQLFGVATAVVLVVAAAMCGIIIAAALIKGGKKTASTGVGGVVLLIVSAAIAMFCHFFVIGEQPLSVKHYSYTDESSNITIAEERYRNGGMVKIYKTTGKPDTEAELLISAPLKEFAEADDRYNISWLSENIISISFLDGSSVRNYQLEFNK